MLILLHLSNASQRSFGLSISTVHWTWRLDGGLDLASRRWNRLGVSTVNWICWIISMGPNKSYKYNLTNLLVSLIIMLSLNHQNHKQWPNRAMFLTPFS